MDYKKVLEKFEEQMEKLNTEGVRAIHPRLVITFMNYVKIIVATEEKLVTLRGEVISSKVVEGEKE